MARKQRIVIPEKTLHIVQRGNNRASVFFETHDYRQFLSILENASWAFDCPIHAYVLLENQVHLLLTPQAQDGPAKMMQAIGRQYVRYINNTYARSGTLWDGRYRSSLLEAEQYLFTCSGYMEMLPVKRKCVADPGDYPWSSYKCNAWGEADQLVQPHVLYKQLGGSASERQRNYRKLMAGVISERQDTKLNEALMAGMVMGSDSFKSEVEHIINRSVSVYSHGGDRKSNKFKNDQVKCLRTPTLT